MLIIHLTFIVYWVIKYKKFVKGAMTLFGIASILTLTYNYSSFFKIRIDEAISTLNSENDLNASSTSEMRLAIWKTSAYLITNKPLIGYGTGDVKDVLLVEYQSRNLSFILDKKLNAHNQFLQTTIAIGLVGGILLIMMLLIPIFMSLKNKHYLYLGFLLLMIINFSTESMLERQLGVVFYSFFNSLFFISYFSFNSLKTEE